MVACINSETLPDAETVTWVWFIQDIVGPDMLMQGRVDTLEEAKKAVHAAFLTWLKWANL